MQVLHGHGHLDLAADEVGCAVGADGHGLRADLDKGLSGGAGDLVGGDGGLLLINYYLLLLLGEGLDARAVGKLERVELHLLCVRYKDIVPKIS